MTETKKPAEQSASRTAAVLLKADYWPNEDVRHLAGETIELPIAEAKRLVGLEKAAPTFGDDD